jgi:hypothetical protein
MPEVDPSRTSDLPITRRTVLRTGTRLAYASPLIAASLSLDSVQAAAVVSGAGCGDCAALSTECMVGVCDELHNQCRLQPVNEDHCCGDPHSGSRCTAGVCTTYTCDAGVENIGGICVPYQPGQCVRDGCECGTENIGGICVPLPSCIF